MPPTSAPRASTSLVNDSQMAATPTGTLTKKIHSQPSDSVSTPPTSGPIATAPPVVAPQMPKAVARSEPWNSWAISASEVANMIAPPMPCTPRKRSSLARSPIMPDESSARSIVLTTCPTARCSSSSSAAEGDSRAAASSSATTGRAARAHSIPSR